MNDAKDKDVQSFAIPAEFLGLLRRRTQPLLRHYGRFIDTVSIETLCFSCYSQGVEDTMRIMDKKKEQP